MIIKKETFKMMKHENETHNLQNGANLIKCHNCGNSIDATKDICEFCHSKQKYYQEWILIK